MDKLGNWIIFLSLLLMTNCHPSRFEFYDCYTENRESLFSKIQSDFENQLESRYRNGEFSSNLVEYLENLQDDPQSIHITPALQYQSEIHQSGIMEDIWTEKSINNTSRFIDCLNRSENELTREYLDRILQVGDMSPSAVGSGAIQLIADKQDIDMELKLIFLINFYLIGMS